MNAHIHLRCVLFLDAYLVSCRPFGIDGFHCPIRILSPLILGSVDLSVTVGEVDHLLT